MRCARLHLLILLALIPLPALALGPFVAFESGHVRPLAVSPDGSRLFAVNTPDNRLEVFQIDGSGLTPLASVPVGMEPVAVAARSNDEVWVVNHLSDSVSIVDVSATPPVVVRTLLVGDEPNDIVFAGPGGNRAFISTAHRGQNSPHAYDNYEDEGIDRADVWAFDANAPGAGLGGTPLSVSTVFGDKPRGLVASNDGSQVFVGILSSGNRTGVVGEATVCDGGVGASSCAGDGTTMPGGLAGGLMPGGLPDPNSNHQSLAGPEVGLVVKFDPSAGASGEWRDELDRNWNNAVRFSLPDKDVFTIDANASPPAAVTTGPNPEDDRACTGVGTILFNMIAKPGSNLIYVTNTEARNEIRFEGPGGFVKSSGDPPSVRGRLHEARITVLDPSQPTCSVTPRHLNKHIDYSISPVPAGVEDDSLATPLGMAISSDGNTLYVAAFGSAKVGVFSTAALENDSFVPDSADHIDVPGGGPTGLILDETNHRLYVLTRFDNAVATIDLGSNTEIDNDALFNPEPASVVAGRPFLYDARVTGSNGEASCSACHIFGNMDDLSWDLGDPDGDNVAQNFNPNGPIGGDQSIHPMKGPMTTQSLRGLADHGPMHWRGDRTGATFEGDPNALDESQAFNAFNVAFPGLIGRDEGQLAPADMQAFTDFILQVTYPPNPIRQLSNALRADEGAGRSIYFNTPATDGVATCNGCHTLDPANGFFGSDGRTTFENETQEMKVAHLRNAYQKVGMFGMPDNPFITSGNNGDQGPQVRSVGFLHDGVIDTVFRFLNAGVFFLNTTQQRQLEAFTMAFDTTLAPIVGQQVTLTATNAAQVGPRIDLMIQRAGASFDLVNHPGANECDLIAKMSIAGAPRGAVYDPVSSRFTMDSVSSASQTDAQIRALAATPGQEVTYTCAPPGSGTRMGIDRDLDGILDADEGGVGGNHVLISGKRLVVVDKDGDPSRRRITLVSKDASVVVGPGGDPTIAGAILAIVNPSTGESASFTLPAGNWSGFGNPPGSKGYRYRDNTFADGPCNVGRVRQANGLRFVCKRSGVPFSLDEASQGFLTATFQAGAEAPYCMGFGGTVIEKQATAGKTGRFLAKDAPVPAACILP